MSGLAPLAALLLAAAAPAPSVALLPLEPLGTGFEQAVEMQGVVRGSLAALEGLRVLDEDATRRALDEEPALAACAEPQCLARAAQLLGVDFVLTGVVGGLGGFRSLVLKRSDRLGKVVSTVNEALSDEWRQQVPGLVRAAMESVPRAPAPAIALQAPEAPRRPEWRAPLAWATSAGALATVAIGTVFGLSSRSIAGDIERAETGCAGTGGDYASCVAARFETGRSRARMANVFFGIGAALAVGSAGLWLWPDDEPATIGVGPGPAALGLSAHGRF